MPKTKPLKRECKKDSKEPDYFIGHPRRKLARDHLPSKREVLSYLRFLRNDALRQFTCCIGEVSNTVRSFWETNGFPSILLRNVSRKVKSLQQQLDAARKHKSSAKSQRFKDSLDELFDISHAEIDDQIANDPQRSAFWKKQQCAGEPLLFGKLIDKATHDAEQPKENPAEQPDEIPPTIESTVEPTIDDCEGSEKGNDSDFALQASPALARKKAKRIAVLNSVVVENLDREKVSNRGAVGLVASVASALGQDVKNLSLSKSTSCRRRKQARSQILDSVKASYDRNKALTVHFDGKQLLQNRSKREKIAVVVTGNGIPEQILAAEFIEDGTGRTIAEFVYKCLQDWDLTGTIKVKSYDTAKVNSGIRNGAAAILDKLLGRKLLDFPCRHHIYELILSCAFRVCFPGKTTAPDEVLFKPFRDQWHYLDHTEYEPYEGDAITADDKQRLQSIFEELLQKNYIRRDYEELLQLGLMCVSDECNYSFRIPGATHHARWMSKAIYCLKMYLLRGQYPGEDGFPEQLKRFVTFILKVYLEGWYKAPLATSAPRNDLEFLEKLDNYPDREIGEATYAKMVTHLWYLSDINIGLAFFDPKVSDETKKEMFSRLTIKRDRRDSHKLVKFGKIYNVAEYVSQNTLDFFNILRISTSFLFLDPASWPTNEHFIEGQQLCESLSVINDCAERAISICSTYNNVGPKSDCEKSELIIAVAKNRREQNNSSKKSVGDYVAQQNETQ
ncbi:uncharacterized protein LOC120423555 [Culex pipiens pallens]|uniref:uncharacterized protein LOC120423555 n=1 Tax=Culex pipiens pallens TaxID=42434 RepID=UPI0019535F5D|nr:uncharacterized protein LOC120423555 [Culex pipiens pallens]